MRFHQLDRLDNTAVRGTKPIADIVALAMLGLARNAMDELFRDRARQLLVMLLGDEVQHHIKNGCTAGTGGNLPINDKQLI